MPGARFWRGLEIVTALGIIVGVVAVFFLPQEVMSSASTSNIILALMMIVTIPSISVALFHSKWSEKANEPRLHATILTETALPHEHPQKIVIVQGSERVSEDARFFYASVMNEGGHTLEDAFPLVQLPEITGSHMIPLVMIPLIGEPQVEVTWDGRPDAFSISDRFLAAIIRDEQVTLQRTSLYGGGAPQIFCIFFADRESGRLHLPTATRFSVKLPNKFHIELSIQAKDLPVEKLSTYEVDARSWNEIEIRET
jgi:hypothetical protein